MSFVVTDYTNPVVLPVIHNKMLPHSALCLLKPNDRTFMMSKRATLLLIHSTDSLKQIFS